MHEICRKDHQTCWKAVRAALWIALALLFLGSQIVAQEAPAPKDGASASLPLDEVLRLHRERDAAIESRRDISRPPVDGTVDLLALRGRVLDDAIEMVAKVRVTIFEDERWVQLPLLDLGPHILVDSVSKGQGYSLVVEEGKLMVLAQKRGVRTFEISLLARAEGEGDRRRVSIRPAAATATTLDLEVDDGHFRLLDVEGVAKRNGFRCFPNKGRYEVEWQRLQPKAAATADAPRPPIESVIARAHLSTVSTLEGDVHHRMLYELRFEGNKTIEWTVPEGTELQKVFVNGRSVAFELEGQILRLAIEPARAGDRNGSVELLLRPPRESYHLSGELVIALPSASWPINHLFARLSLPEVFTYRWSGGSLSPIDKVPAVKLTYDLPTPGDELLFHQSLVQGSSPTVRVAYDIELKGQFYTGM